VRCDFEQVGNVKRARRQPMVVLRFHSDISPLPALIFTGK